MTELVTLTIENQIANIEFNRPEVKNAFNGEVMLQLTQILKNLPSTTRAVIISGKNNFFCAGMDLQWMRSMGLASADENRKDVELLSNMLTLIDELPMPTIAKVQGGAFGGALGIIACCDIVVADNDAKFGFSEVKLGLAPAVISPYVIRAIGVRQARRYFISAEKFTSQAALAMGLVHEIEHEANVEKFIALILQNGPEAIKATKQLCQDLAPIPPAHKKMTTELIAKLRTQPEAQARIKKFLE